MSTRHKGNPEQVRALDAYIKLARAADSVSLTISRSLAQSGLTESQFGVLEALMHIGPMRPCELASKLLTSGANMTTVADNLEKRGLISREKIPEDRRSFTIRLTEEGKQLITGIFPRHAEFITVQMSALEPSEQEALGALCRKLGKAVNPK
ncbi:MAG TPA: MarR family transcriptional regulator [bacterium]|jgi:MarR family 2-MHQ and catechol resistance regulon transcriptional repressor